MPRTSKLSFGSISKIQVFIIVCRKELFSIRFQQWQNVNFAVSSSAKISVVYFVASLAILAQF